MYSLACRDMGTDCSFVAKGKTKEKALEAMKEHGMSEHRMSEADFTPEMVDQAKQVMIQEE